MLVFSDCSEKMFERFKKCDVIKNNITDVDREKTLYGLQCKPTFNYYRRQALQNFNKKLKVLLKKRLATPPQNHESDDNSSAEPIDSSLTPTGPPSSKRGRGSAGGRSNKNK